ncbi:MAG: hypothetical protein QM537_03120 [Candidatus Symbiobacter sp.]|nr:hypothetical protein [Candidatus Symbiobacter sp.]
MKKQNNNSILLLGYAKNIAIFAMILTMTLWQSNHLARAADSRRDHATITAENIVGPPPPYHDWCEYAGIPKGPDGRCEIVD